MTEVFVDPDLVILFWFHPQVTNSSQFYLGGCRWTLAAFLLQQEGGGEDRGEEHGVEQREDREERGTHAGWRITDTLIFQGSPCYHDRVGGATNMYKAIYSVFLDQIVLIIEMSDNWTVCRGSDVSNIDLGEVQLLMKESLSFWDLVSKWWKHTALETAISRKVLIKWIFINWQGRQKFQPRLYLSNLRSMMWSEKENSA